MYAGVKYFIIINWISPRGNKVVLTHVVLKRLIAPKKYSVEGDNWCVRGCKACHPWNPLRNLPPLRVLLVMQQIPNLSCFMYP